MEASHKSKPNTSVKPKDSNTQLVFSKASIHPSSSQKRKLLLMTIEDLSFLLCASQLPLGTVNK